MSNPLPKLLKNPLAIKILLTLAEKDCYINEIADTLNVKDFKRILAVTNELVRLGLVVHVTMSENIHDTPINQTDLYKSEILISDQPIRPLSTALGIPLNEYIELWNNLDQNFNKTDLGSLRKIQFRIPLPIRNKIKGKTPEEIIELFSPLKNQ
ncbi:MAG: hypothetical protein ACTSPV_10435 [Candidatus Hodarchaeales archaeon]